MRTDPWCWCLSLMVAVSAAAAECDSIPTFADGLMPSREVFVSPAGNNQSGNGSLENPYQTISRAAQGVQPGDAIRLLPGQHEAGTYLANLTGTAAQPIWLGGVPAMARPVITGGSQALHLSRVRYLAVEHLEIAGATQNGINCDDGGDYGDPDATRFVIFRHLHFHDIGSGGNQDALKLSGVDDFFVLDCVFERASAGGSGIDHVGCHDGVIARNTFTDMGSNAIQCKGGTRNLEILRNRFLNGGERAINLGGSTGFEFFRPPLSTTEPNVEAADIVVAANLFVGATAPIAYVGATNCLVANNTLVDPGRWLIRILQETTTSPPYTFAPCGGNLFRNNLVYYRRGALSTHVNIGGNTAPATFAFGNNLWYAHDQPAQSAPSLPVTEPNGVTGLDPDFVNAATGDYHLNPGSPAIGKGVGLTVISGDFDGTCFLSPPSVGAWEFVDPATADRDHDGLPDAWELNHELDPDEPADAVVDQDLDGASALEEFVAGTDPQGVGSVFALAIDRSAGGVEVRFATSADRRYQVEWLGVLPGSDWMQGPSLVNPPTPAAIPIAVNGDPGAIIRIRVERIGAGAPISRSPNLE